MMPPTHPTRAIRSSTLWLTIVALFILLILIPIAHGQTAPPTLPQKQVDVMYRQPTTVVNVPAGGNLQQAINQVAADANAPDTLIRVAAGATFGAINLPARSNSKWIYIETSGTLPAPGNRVGASHASQLFKLQMASAPTVTTSAGASFYRLVGVDGVVTGGLQNAIILLDHATNPHHIILDRSYVHAAGTNQVRRGVTMHGSDLAVVDSSITDIKENGADSQAICSWDGNGPFLIQNNLLEGAGENIMFGGASPRNNQTVPSDITIRLNHLRKPSGWRGSSYSVKNLLEFKQGDRVLVEANILDTTWAAGQVGFALLITPRSEDGGARGLTQNLTIRLNKFTNVPQGINIAGKDDTGPSAGTDRVLITNNVIDQNCSGCTNNQRGDGRIFQIGHGPKNLAITHNTATLQNWGTLSMAYGTPKAPGFTYTANVIPSGQYGFAGEGTGTGTPTLNAFFTGWTFTGNVIAGATLSQYPTGNFTSVSQAPPDVGADVAAVTTATACVVSGACAGGTPPQPDTTPPQVTWVSPAASTSVVQGTLVTLLATAVDNQPGVSAVSYTADNQPVVSPYTANLLGTITFVAKATDAAGNVGTSTRTMTVTPPSTTTPVDCLQGAWVVVSLQQATSGNFTLTMSRPTVTQPAFGGKACGASSYTTSVVF